MSKKQSAKSSVAKVATTPNAVLAAEGSTPFGGLPLGFSSLPGFCAFALFAILLFISPYLFSGFWPSSYEYWPQAMFLALASCACVLLALAPEFQTFNPKPLPIILSLFVICCAISFIGTAYLHDSILEFSRVIGVLACFFITRALLAQREYSLQRALWLLGAVSAGAILVCVPAIWDFFNTRNPRQFATFYNPNLFANYCAMALPLTAGAILLLWQNARRNVRVKMPMILICGFVVIAIIALGLIVTSSKGGFLAALCGTLVFLIAVFRAKSERVKTALRANSAVFAIIAILIFGAGAFIFSQMILPRLSSNLENDHSTMFRVYTWAGTWRMAIARPFFGWGAGSFPSAYPQFAQTGYTRSAHQSWLQIAAECGFPASLFLLAACVSGFINGWKALRGNAWPIAAGSLAALTAFCIHGLTDSGWNIISIGVLLMIVLALLETARAQNDEKISEVSIAKSQINWHWLLATLPLAFGSWLSQRAQSGEDLRTESRELMARSAQSSAFEKAQAAVDTDPLSARLIYNLIQAREASGQNADMLYRTLLQLQPTRALNHLYFAKTSQTDREQKDVLFQKAISLDPNDTEIRLIRGNWKLKSGDQSGWKDIEYIAALKDKPYGKYPATPEMVDLNFARAYAMLAERYVRNQDAAKNFIARGLKVIAEARKWEPQRRALEQAAQVPIDESREQTMNELEAQLKTLQEKLS